MVELPSGTVSLLFSDIEGSTRLVRELGADWARVLDQQRSICRGAWAANDGVELGTEGDSFFVVFASATDAVTAAVAAQRGMAEAEWPSKPVRIRIGVHTGSPQRHADGYVGMDVHKAARVAGVAHGGQVLVSGATAGIVGSDLQPGVGFVDLGGHLLKDIPERIRLWQVTATGLGREFPAVRSRGAAGSLPVALTPTVGRTGELAELRILLEDRDVRLLTLTGPGGSGKSRLATALAAEIADAYVDGVFFVPMAPVTTADGMWAAMAQVLDVPADGQVPSGFFEHVADRQCLLVLDNLEQISEADTVVRDLLAEASRVRVVVTSRRPLHVEGEYEHAVPPLTLPVEPTAELDTIMASGAVQMFVDHARRVRNGFALTEANAGDVAALCVALDGLPLAIELAAARVRLLSPAAILARIDKSLDLASADRSRDARQRTIRQAIEWSYHLLGARQQTVLDHLAVFEGGASMEAIDAVLPDDEMIDQLEDIVFDLADASLITVAETESGEPRLDLLETVKRFAGEQLVAKGRSRAAALAHAQHFYSQMCAAKETTHVDFPVARAEFLLDIDNYAALAERKPGLLDPDHYGDLAIPHLHIIARFAAVCLVFNRYDLGLRACNQALDGCDVASEPFGAAAVMGTRADLEDSLQLLDACVDDARAAIAILESTPEPFPEGWPSLVSPVVVANNVYRSLAQALITLGRFAEAREAVDQALSLVDGPPILRIRANEAGYDLAMATDRFDDAQQYLHALREALIEEGDQANLVYVEYYMVELDLRRGAMAEAWQRLRAMTQATLSRGDAVAVIAVVETFAQILADQYPRLAARALGAAATGHVLEGVPREGLADERMETIQTSILDALPESEWEAEYERGRGESLIDLLREMAALPPPRADSSPSSVRD